MKNWMNWKLHLIRQFEDNLLFQPTSSGDLYRPEDSQFSVLGSFVNYKNLDKPEIIQYSNDRCCQAITSLYGFPKDLALQTLQNFLYRDIETPVDEFIEQVCWGLPLLIPSQCLFDGEEIWQVWDVRPGMTYILKIERLYGRRPYTVGLSTKDLKNYTILPLYNRENLKW